MLARNPARIDFQKRFEEIIDEYNSEKDRQTIEQTLTDNPSEIKGHKRRSIGYTTGYIWHSAFE